MSRMYSAALALAAAGCLFWLVPAIGRDLPFAPSRSKAKENPMFMSSFEHEAITAPLDAGWTPGDQIDKENLFRLMQFVPPGERVGEATKFINVAAYLDVPAKESAHDYMMRCKKEFEKRAPKSNISWSIVSDSNPADVTFEYSIKDWPESPDQYELQRALRGKDGIHVIIYHLSKPEATDAERKKMLAWLNSVMLITRDEYNSIVRGTRMEAPAQKKSAVAAPAEKKPAAAAPAEKKPAVAAPAEKKPAVAAPAEKKPAVAAPAEKKPAAAAPAEKKPAVAAPAEKKPAAAAPAEKKPAAAAPPEKKPAATQVPAEPSN